MKAFVASSSHMNLYFPISHVNFETLVGFTKNIVIYSKWMVKEKVSGK
jgi:hypothetical protein